MWIFIGKPEKANEVNPINIPEMNKWPFTYKSYTFKADLESTAESLIDPYHIAFVHRDSIKSFMGQIKESPADFNLKILDDGIEGFYRRANVGTKTEKIYFGMVSVLFNFGFYIFIIACFPKFAKSFYNLII